MLLVGIDASFDFDFNDYLHSAFLCPAPRYSATARKGTIPDLSHFRVGNFLASSVIIASSVSGNRLRTHNLVPPAQRPFPTGQPCRAPIARPLRVPPAQRRPVPAGGPHLAQKAPPWALKAQRRLVPSGRPRLAPIAQTRFFRGSQRRPISARQPHLAPIAQPRWVRKAQRLSFAVKS
jgi:hypothetical protein